MDKWIDFNGAGGYYKVEGKGKAIVLIHGFIEDGSMWNGVINGLAKNYKLIIPDLPGFGKASLPDVDLTMEWYAEYIRAIVKAEKLNKVLVLGHSMGGYVTLNFAEKYGELLSGFGLINSHCFEDTPEKKINRQKGIAFVKKYGTEFFVRELYCSIFHQDFLKKNQKLVDGLIKNAQQYSPEAVMQASAAMMNRKDKTEVLKRASVPVLFIQGKDDESAPPEYTLKQASYPPFSDFNLFENSKHMSVFEKKAELIKIINAFAARL